MLLLSLLGMAEAAVLRHAIVVGANDGGGNLEALHYAELDAERMSAVLVELGGMDPANVTVLYAPSAGMLREALQAHAQLASRAPEDLFVFYYSGHADARGLRLGQDAYPFDALRADIRGVDADVRLGVLDACKSGTITRLKGAQVSTPFLVEEELAAEGEAWMTAASADESAQESDRLRGSFFTHYLISGLRGAADTGDGQVSVDEAYRYAYDRVVDQTGGTTAGTQHPNYDYRLKGEGDLALTEVSQGRALVIFPAEVAGEVTVLKMPDRTPVAEVAKGVGSTSTLALPPGTYLLRLRTGREVKETLVGLFEGARVTASRWDAAPGQGGTSKGADAFSIARQAAEAQAPWIRDAINPADLRHSPLIAGGISAILPGSGQFYNRQFVKGGVYLTAAGILLSGSVLAFEEDRRFFHGSITGPDFLRLSAAMVYGASIADAAYNARRREDHRPYEGITLSTSAQWATDGDPAAPWVAGLTVEWMPVKQFSLAVERIGWTSTEPGSGAWGMGGRGSVFFLQGDRVRPSFFVAGGMRYRYTPDVAGFLVPTVGTGSAIRWYVTPRYFVEHEWRIESEGGEPRFLLGGGLGVHFGGRTGEL